MRRPHVKLPFAPLESYGLHNTGMERLMGTQINLTRWRKTGLSLRDADRVALELGVLPDDIWGDDWQAAWDERADRRRQHNAFHNAKRVACRLRANEPAVLV